MKETRCCRKKSDSSRRPTSLLLLLLLSIFFLCPFSSFSRKKINNSRRPNSLLLLLLISIFSLCPPSSSSRKKSNNSKRPTSLLLLFLFTFFLCPSSSSADCVPPPGCNLALAYYVVSSSDSLSSIAQRFNTNVTQIKLYSNISDSNSVKANDTLIIPFTCDCDGTQLAHIFSYTVVTGDTATSVAQNKYGFLSTVQWMTNANNNTDLGTLYPNNVLYVPVNCSCGDPSVPMYGLFTTYVARDGDNLASLSKKFNISGDLLQRYNSRDINKLQPSLSILFIPAKDSSGKYPPFNMSALKENGGTNVGAIVGGSIGGSIVILALAALGIFYFFFYLPQRYKKVNTLDNRHEASSGAPESSSTEIQGPQSHLSMESQASNAHNGLVPPRFLDLGIDKSVEFSYEELASTTDNFNIAKEIGRGGYGSVYYGEVRGQRLAIKMMNMQATREFLSELNVLTRVHHTNLVRLVGYCTVDSLFLVYEYVENGTLSQHLRASRKEGVSPLTWAVRIQIALDAARGLEYIHEHTVPTYIHRDIKSSNILLDKNFRAKVSDFGLTKLTESCAASSTVPSRLVGTFGYMAPEYARFGDVSPKADVYSFGVVLFEILSAKEAIVHNVEPQAANSRGLVSLFEEALSDSDGKEKLRGLIDPALGDQYPLESAWKMANLALACTREEAMLRPNMRAVVVALMTLSSSTQEWDGVSFSGDHTVGDLYAR